MKYRTSAKYLHTISALLLLAGALFGQNSEIDSLQGLISRGSQDSLQVDALNELSRIHFGTDLEISMEMAVKAVELGSDIGYKNGIAYGLKNIGIVHYLRGDFVEAVTTWQNSLEVFRELGNDVGIANILSNIGVVYYDEGDYSKALEYYLQSLKEAEKIKDTLRIITALGNIGATYIDRQATHEQALEYSKRVIKLSDEVRELTPEIQRVKANAANSMGEVYLTRSLPDSALMFFQIALDAKQNAEGRIFTLVSIGNAYRQKGEPELALANIDEALQLARELNLAPNEAHALAVKAQILSSLDRDDKAIETFKEAIQIAKSINALKRLEKCYRGLKWIYEEDGNYDSAYKYQKMHLEVKDSIYNSDTERLLSNQMFDFQIQKKQDEINLQKKDLEIAALDIRKQKVINGLVGAGMLSVAVFLFHCTFTKEKNRQGEGTK